MFPYKNETTAAKCGYRFSVGRFLWKPENG